MVTVPVVQVETPVGVLKLTTAAFAPGAVVTLILPGQFRVKTDEADMVI